MNRSAAVFLCLAFRLAAQSPDALYEEAKVPHYSLPDVLSAKDGNRVDRAGWPLPSSPR